MRRIFFVLLFFAVFSLSLSGQTDLGSTPLRHQSTALAIYARLPLDFEVNSGQTDARVKFLSHGRGFSLFLADAEAVVVLKKPDHGRTKSNPSLSGSTIRMQLLGANTTARVVGSEELPGKANYFIGNDPSTWRTNIPTYAKVKYEDVFPGIDLVYYGNQGQLEYDFIVSPGIEPSSIGMRFQTDHKLTIDGNGDLLLQAEGVRFQKPRIFQQSGDVKRDIDGRYDLSADNTIRFAVGDYDRSKPLVIDPILVYSTYLGGSLQDFAAGIAVDASGNAYIVGQAFSFDFPTANALQPTNASSVFDPANVFITKINLSGSALVYSTYLGGSGRDAGSGIAVDPSGNVYVAGRANSFDFPTVNALQPVSHACCGVNGTTGFVSKLNPTGSALIYSTFLGGFGEDSANAIAADATGNAYVTGTTSSPIFPDTCNGCNFPTTPNALQSNLGGTPGEASNAFVTKINPDGSALVFSTYLGGSSHFDVGSSIAVDTAGNVYVTGNARSSDFPTANAIQPTLKAKNTSQTNNHNAFVSKINASGSAFVYSTYLGGSGNDDGGGITVDSSGNAYVVGGTSSADFPTASPLQSTLVGGGNAFLTKMNPSGSALVYSTFFGTGNTAADAIAVDPLGNAYIAGFTDSINFPTLNAFQPAFGGSFADGFVAEINASGNALVYSTFLGGSGADFASGIALDPLGNVFVTGSTDSTNFPTALALQHALGGAGATNAFVSRIGSTIADRLNLSGVEFFAGHPCTVDGQPATCGAHSLGWGGGSGHIANGWVPFPGDGKAVWEANVAYEGDVAFGKTVELVKGSRLELLEQNNKLLSEIVTEGTVTWPTSTNDDLGCGRGVAKVHALFRTKQDAPASFVGCLHDLPAGSVVPPKIWGTFFTLKDSTDGHN
jgi:hypothetical protein